MVEQAISDKKKKKLRYEKTHNNHKSAVLLCESESSFCLIKNRKVYFYNSGKKE